MCFKPYYNWNTFNTTVGELAKNQYIVSFKPYYNWNTFNTRSLGSNTNIILSFKPYYNWNTFNTCRYSWSSVIFL